MCIRDSGNIVRKRTIAEDHRRFPRRGQCVMPCGDSHSEGLDFVAADILCKAHEKCTCAYAMNGFADDVLMFDWNIEVKPEFE